MNTAATKLLIIEISVSLFWPWIEEKTAGKNVVFSSVLVKISSQSFV